MDCTAPVIAMAVPAAIIIGTAADSIGPPEINAAATAGTMMANTVIRNAIMADVMA